MTTTDIMVYLHSLEHGHIKIGTNKIPINAINLSVFDVKLTNIGDAHGRIMLTLDRRLAERHGLVLPPAQAQAARPIPQPTPTRVIEQPKAAPMPSTDGSRSEPKRAIPDKDFDLEADLKDILDSELGDDEPYKRVERASPAMPRTSLLAAAGIKRPTA
jgi:hypothetical protein